MIQNNGGEGIKDVIWGLSTDRLTPGFYDNDNKADISVWRHGDQGIFYTLSSATTIRCRLFRGEEVSAAAVWELIIFNL